MITSDDGLKLEGGHRFEPSVTIKHGETIEVKYNSGRPYAYRVVDAEGQVLQSGKVLATN